MPLSLQWEVQRIELISDNHAAMMMIFQGNQQNWNVFPSTLMYIDKSHLHRFAWNYL